jgi:hypothetical protein
MPPPAVIRCTSPGPITPPLHQAVLVLDLAVQHVCDRLDAAVRVLRKAADIVRWVVRSKIIEKKERIELRHFSIAEGAPQGARLRLRSSARFSRLS